jgi:hypothetical protein
MHTLPATGLRQQAEMLASLSLKHLSSATRNKLADDDLSVNAYPTDCGGFVYVGAPNAGIDERNDEHRQQRRGDHAARPSARRCAHHLGAGAVPHMIGSLVARPARITATVIAFGRTRSTAPSRIASSSTGSVSRAATSRLQRLLQVQQHHHAELGGHAGQRDEADAGGHRQVVAQRPENQTPPSARRAASP